MCFEGSYIIENDVAMVGVGGKAVISDGMSYDNENYFVVLTDPKQGHSPSVYLENFEFECNKKQHGNQGVLNIEMMGSLTCKDCLFRFKCVGIMVRALSSLAVTHCEFDGATTAIEVDPLARDVTVIRSVFRHCGLRDDRFLEGEHGCIQVVDTLGRWRMVDFEHEPQDLPPFLDLVCDGNLFEDNHCLPIAERARPKFVEDETRNEYWFVAEAQQTPIYCHRKHLQVLVNNELRGFNATKLRKRKKQIRDANKMYFNDETFSVYDKGGSGFLDKKENE